MRINNHLDQPIILNIYNRGDIVNLNDLQLYNINGSTIDPKSSIEISKQDGTVMYFSNIAGTKISHISTSDVEGNIINLWEHESDVTQCNQNRVCRLEENIVMSTQLPNHLIWHIYNDVTYIILSLILAILIATIAIVIIIPIQK